MAAIYHGVWRHKPQVASESGRAYGKRRACSSDSKTVSEVVLY